MLTTLHSRTAILPVLLMFGLAGCSSSFLPEGSGDEATRASVDASLQEFGDQGNVRSGGARVSDETFVAAQEQRENAAAMLPSDLQRPNGVQLQSRDRMSLADISARLSEVTGLAHIAALGPTGARVSEDEIAETASAIENEVNTSSPDVSPSDASLTDGAGSPVADIRIRPNLEGPLSDVLDEIAAAFEVEWFYIDGRILFQDYITEQYQVSALPTSTETSTSIGDDDIATDTQLSLEVWEEAREGLESVLSEAASLSVSQSTGSVTVTGTMSDHQRVSDFIGNLNENVGQQIAFDVYVLTINLNEENRTGVDLAAAFDSGSSTTGSIQNTGSSTPDGPFGQVNIGTIAGNFNLEGVVQNLSRQGEVSVSTRAGTTTSNNRVAPIDVVDEFSYLAEVSIDERDDRADRVNRRAETETTGFQLQIMPRVLSNREIMLHYSVRLSELNELTTFGDGNEAIQLPDISTTSFEQQATVRNNETVVMAGFDRTRVEVEESSGGFLGVGGSSVESEERVATVLMITPRLIDRSR